MGSKWRTRVRIESLMAAKSCKEMYDTSTKIQNTTNTNQIITLLRLETCSVVIKPYF